MGQLALAVRGRNVLIAGAPKCGTSWVIDPSGMLDKEQAPEAPSRTRSLRSSVWIRASRSGFCRMRVRLGEPVKEHDLVAEVVDPALGTRTLVKSNRTGLAIGAAVDSVVTAGDALLHVAETRSG